MKPRQNLFRLAIVSWIMVIYLLATGNLAWYLWFFVGALLFERVTLQIALWVEGHVIKAMAKQMIDQAQAAAKSGGISLGGQ